MRRSCMCRGLRGLVFLDRKLVSNAKARCPTRVNRDYVCGWASSDPHLLLSRGYFYTHELSNIWTESAHFVELVSHHLGFSVRVWGSQSSQGFKLIWSSVSEGFHGQNLLLLLGFSGSVSIYYCWSELYSPKKVHMLIFFSAFARVCAPQMLNESQVEWTETNCIAKVLKVGEGLCVGVCSVGDYVVVNSLDSIDGFLKMLSVVQRC